MLSVGADGALTVELDNRRDFPILAKRPPREVVIFSSIKLVSSRQRTPISICCENDVVKSTSRRPPVSISFSDRIVSPLFLLAPGFIRVGPDGSVLPLPVQRV